MPMETAREVVQAAESSASWLQWILGGIASTALTIWGFFTGRVSTLERTSMTKESFDHHVEDEAKKFDLLFNKHHEICGEVNEIKVMVARIEEKLDARLSRKP